MGFLSFKKQCNAFVCGVLKQPGLWLQISQQTLGFRFKIHFCNGLGSASSMSDPPSIAVECLLTNGMSCNAWSALTGCARAYSAGWSVYWCWSSIVMGALFIDTSGEGSGFADGVTRTVNKASGSGSIYSHSDDSISFWQVGSTRLGKATKVSAVNGCITQWSENGRLCGLQWHESTAALKLIHVWQQEVGMRCIQPDGLLS